MLWAIDRPKRHRALRAIERQLVIVSKAEEELPCYGHAYFGGLVAFTFDCPGPCSTVYDIRPRQRQRWFDPETQPFRCSDCDIELQLSILARSSLPKQEAAEYETNLLSDIANSPPDAVPTVEEAALMRRGGEIVRPPGTTSAYVKAGASDDLVTVLAVVLCAALGIGSVPLAAGRRLHGTRRARR